MRLLLLTLGLSLIHLGGTRSSAADDPKPAKDSPKLKVGDPPPPLKATKWLTGGEVKAFEKGKVYMVEFWATWCGPCVVMMPHLGDIQEELGPKGVTVIGFTAKDPGNTAEKVTKFVEKRGDKLGYTIAYADDRETYDAYMKAAGQGGIPCSFVIGKDGKIAFIGHPLFLDEVLPKVLDGTWDAVKGEAELEAADKLWDATFDVDQEAGRSGQATGRVGGLLGQVAPTRGRPLHDRRPAQAPGGGQAVRRSPEAGRIDGDEGDEAERYRRPGTVADAVSADAAAGQADLAKIGLRVAESALAINGETARRADSGDQGVYGGR